MTLLALSSLLFASALSVSSASPPLPHVIFILADDYGWNDVGYHQNAVSSANPLGLPTANATDGMIHTPNIDRLSAEGVRLESYYVQPLCSPTRGTIMTGRYVSHTGIGPNVIKPTMPYAMPKAEVFLPEFMRRAGYDTAAVGKWHLGFCDRRYTPTYRGFDSFLGYLEGAEDYYTHTRQDAGFNGYDFRNGSTAGALAPVLKRGVEHDYSAHVFAREVQRKVLAHDQTRPLFLYLAFQSVHAPLQAPARFMSMYKGKMGGDVKRRTVAAMVTAMDEAIGNITQTLNDTGMLRDTVMIFSTDNGGPNPTHNNYPLRGGKATTWEGGVRGTGWVRGTESALAPVQGGRSTAALMHTTDWLPTIVKGLARVDPASSTPASLPLDGTNQWQAIAGSAGVSSRDFIAHNVPTTGFAGAFRKGDLKVLFEGMQTTVPARPQLPPQGFTPAGDDTVPTAAPYGANGTLAYLFNITADPTESNNLLLSADGAYDDAMASIVKAYLAYQADKVAPVVEDLSDSHTQSDPTANPATHTDNAWGPFDMSTLAHATSKCDYV